MKTKSLLVLIVIITIVIGAGFYVDTRLRGINLMFNTTVIPRNGTQSDSSSTAEASLASKIDLKNYGMAPDFAGISTWLNSSPLTIEGLRGKVVLIDFWTYSCINCIRTLPYVTKWYDTYKNNGFVVVGVHTPEFAFEQDTNNVKDAIQYFNIHYPVAQDNQYRTWNAYSNQYWPAEYLIDKNGNIVHVHFGEGEYDVTENIIRALLGLNPATTTAPSNSLDQVQSPEMYFGTNRLNNLTPEQTPSLSSTMYSFPQNLSLNNFALEGNWQFSPKSIALVSGQGKIKLKFHSGKLYIVASSANPNQLSVVIDGKDQLPVVVKDSKLYTLFDSNDYSDHIVEVTIDQPGFNAFTFTFG
ncbi:MAG: thioredoxin family protein [Patescibacteria group bacterium]|nr:thioredoxin family protein [Patescibacteria group bacterium]MDE2438171.1 thioredoxin family protein [Patescibacteria group bacterium]